MYYYLNLEKLDSSSVIMVKKILNFNLSDSIPYLMIRVVGDKKYIYGSNFRIGEELSVSNFLEISK